MLIEKKRENAVAYPKKKNRSCVTQEKKLYCHTLYFNTLFYLYLLNTLRLIKTIRLKISQTPSKTFTQSVKRQIVNM